MPVPYGLAPSGFRLPDETAIGRVRLQVADLGRSIEYYTRVVGFELLTRVGPVAELGAHGDKRPLLELREKRGVSPAPPRGAYGLYHFAILLPDRAQLGRLIVHLVRSGVRFGAADHWVSEAVYLTDPDGLGIEIYADRPRSAWRAHNAELAMGTDPLDTDSLVDASSDLAWQGLPAGTTIGHVHLHVGDLRRAEAFYHATLGLDKVVWSYPGALFMSAGGYHHHLGTNTWSPGPSAHDGQARLLDWELVLPTSTDVAAAVESLERAGFNPGRLGEHWRVVDPWQTALRLSSSR